MRIFALMLAASTLFAPQCATAMATWNWSFADQEGTFVTTGNASSGQLAPGRYTLTNFSVTKSQYLAIADMFTAGDFGFAYTTVGGPPQPYYLDWDGKEVIRLNNSNVGFTENSPRTAYWSFGRYDWSRVFVTFAVANGTSRAGLSNAGFDLDFGKANDAPLSIALTSTAAIPEPASWLTMLFGFAIVGLALRRYPEARMVIKVRTDY